MRRHQKRRNTLSKGQGATHTPNHIHTEPWSLIVLILPPPPLDIYCFIAWIISNKWLRFKKSRGGCCFFRCLFSEQVVLQPLWYFSVIFILCIFFNRRDEESRPLLDRPIPTIVIEEWWLQCNIYLFLQTSYTRFCNNCGLFSLMVISQGSQFPIIWSVRN